MLLVASRTLLMLQVAQNLNCINEPEHVYHPIKDLLDEAVHFSGILTSAMHVELLVDHRTTVL